MGRARRTAGVGTHGAYIVGQPVEATLVRLRAWCGPWLGWWAVLWQHQYPACLTRRPWGSGAVGGGCACNMIAGKRWESQGEVEN